MKRAMIVCALALASCSWNFDGQAPDLPLLGAPPDTDGLPHLNQAPAGLVHIMYGWNYSPWAAFDEPSGATQAQRLVHLEPPYESQLFAAPDYVASWGTFYIFDKQSTGTRITIISPGETAPDAQFDYPPGEYVFRADDRDTRFLFFLRDPSQTTYRCQLRDGSYSRDLPYPDGVDPTDPTAGASYSFDWSGKLLFVQDPLGHLIVHDTEDLHDFDLGVRPQQIIYDDTNNTIVTCGADGVRVAPVSGDPDGSKDVVIDSMPCDDGGGIEFHGNGVLYQRYGALTFAPLKGGAPPSTLLEAGLRFVEFGPDGNTAVYSTEQPGTYVNDASDAWLGSWKIMNRGLQLGFSRDKSHAHWLENAAQPSGVGDLMSAPMNGPPVHLARNTRQYLELADGRVVAATNHAIRGVQNRLVTIDENAHTQTWLASAAHEFVEIPWSDDILIDVVSGPSTFDIVRLPLPVKQH